MLQSGVGRSGVRVVAAFEAAKGALILLAGFGLLSLIHKDLELVAEELVRHFHLDPAGHYPRIFIEAADHVSDVHLWLLAALAFGYAVLRLAEAYGLWRRQRWAAWLAVASGAIYVPLEIHALLHGMSKVKVGALAVNVGIVLYMSYVLWRARQSRESPARVSVCQRTDSAGQRG